MESPSKNSLGFLAKLLNVFLYYFKKQGKTKQKRKTKQNKTKTNLSRHPHQKTKILENSLNSRFGSSWNVLGVFQ